MEETPARRYGVIVPAKPLATAKSRLAALGDDVRRDLVAAFLHDTVAAVLDCPVVDAVLVVTDDLTLAALARSLGAQPLPDGAALDLNASLVTGAAELVRRRPGLCPVALCGDLPALRPDDVAACLSSLPSDRPGFVADAEGSGTTLYAAPSLALFVPGFGFASRRRHLEAGAVELEATESVRRDVDTSADLVAALSLGVGPRTSSVAARHRLG